MAMTIRKIYALLDAPEDVLVSFSELDNVMSLIKIDENSGKYLSVDIEIVDDEISDERYIEVEFGGGELITDDDDNIIEFDVLDQFGYESEYPIDIDLNDEISDEMFDDEITRWFKTGFDKLEEYLGDEPEAEEV
jgi:hypothetical protein